MLKSLDVLRLFHLIDNTPRALRAENQRVIISYFTTFYSDICPCNQYSLYHCVTDSACHLQTFSRFIVVREP